MKSHFRRSWGLTCRFCASLKHKDNGQTKFIKPNSQRQDIIIKYWGKYQVDPQRGGLTLIAKLTWSNLGLKGVLNKRK